MRRTILMLGAVLVASAVARAQDASSHTAADSTLIANERALYEAIASNDKAGFKALVLPEGLWATASGFVPIGQLADHLTSFQLPKWVARTSTSCGRTTTLQWSATSELGEARSITGRSRSRRWRRRCGRSTTASGSPSTTRRRISPSSTSEGWPTLASATRPIAWSGDCGRHHAREAPPSSA